MSMERKDKIYAAIERCCFASAVMVSVAMLIIFVIYPAISRRQNGIAMFAAVTAYAQEASGMSQAKIDAHLLRAYQHNAELAQLPYNALFRLAQWAVVPYD